MSDELKSTAAQHHDGIIPAALASEICPNLSLAPVDLVEIHRYLGYPPEVVSAPTIADRIAQVVAKSESCLKPRGAYAVYAVSSRTPHSLNLNDTTISGNIGEFLEHADRVAVFVVTVGKEISHLAESASKSGNAFSAWIMDAVGSWAAEGAADALMERIRRHLQDEEDLTLRYSPGYCGMDMGQQSKLFQLVQADSVGVKLLPSMLMYPLKSISGLVGLAPKEAVSRYRSPCDLCPRVGCYMQR